MEYSLNQPKGLAMNNTITVNTPEVRKKEFVNYIHNFRGIAIIFVVAGHILLNWSKDSLTHDFFKALWEDGTVLFIFIAGYLFEHLSKKFEYKSYLQKKLQNVILPYFIVSIPIIIYRVYTNDIPGYVTAFKPGILSWTAMEKTAYFYITGAHLQPLWFVPMITLFYLAAPLLIYIDRHPKLYYLLLPLIVVSLLVDRESLNDIPRMFVHFSSVYVFGMFLCRYKQRFLDIAHRFWWLITALTILMLLATFIYVNSYFNPLIYLQKMFFCMFFIYWLWRFERYIPKFMAYLAEVSFGIFFLHYYFLLIVKAVYEKMMKHPIPGNVVYWTINLIVVIAITVLFIGAVKKIFPKKSRQLIGC